MIKKIIISFFLFTEPLLTFPVHCASSVVLRCPGRQEMTVSLTDHNLATEQWGTGHFEVAPGYESTYLPDGDPVHLWRFMNGDQWFMDMRNDRHFFSFAGQDTLKPCTAGKWVMLPTVSPPEWKEH